MGAGEAGLLIAFSTATVKIFGAPLPREVESSVSRLQEFRWTLFGPYIWDRKGPLGNGRTWKINRLRILGTLPTSGNLLEVAVRASLNEFGVWMFAVVAELADAHA